MYVLYAIALGIITAHSTSHRPQSERGEHCAGDHEARAIPTDHIVLIKRLQTTDPVARVNIHRLHDSGKTSTDHVAQVNIHRHVARINDNQPQPPNNLDIPKNAV